MAQISSQRTICESVNSFKVFYNSNTDYLFHNSFLSYFVRSVVLISVIEKFRQYFPRRFHVCQGYSTDNPTNRNIIDNDNSPKREIIIKWLCRSANLCLPSVLQKEYNKSAGKLLHKHSSYLFKINVLRSCSCRGLTTSFITC